MKRSEFYESEWGIAFREGLSREQARSVAEERCCTAERAGVIWDPEGPVWEGGGLRLMNDGSWELRNIDGWHAYAPSHAFAPAFGEFARRLLAEQAEKSGIAELPEGDREAVADTAYWREQEVDSWLEYYGITPGCPTQLLSRGALRGMGLRLLGAK